MAKSVIKVVQGSPRTGLGIPVKTKKTPLTTLPSSVRPGLHTRTHAC